MSTDIDLLMQYVEEINAKTPPLSSSDVDTIIAYHRHCRAQKAAGVKPTRPKVDIASILGPLTPKVEPPKKGPRFVLKSVLRQQAEAEAAKK